MGGIECKQGASLSGNNNRTHIRTTTKYVPKIINGESLALRDILPLPDSSLYCSLNTESDMMLAAVLLCLTTGGIEVVFLFLDVLFSIRRNIYLCVLVVVICDICVEGRQEGDWGFGWVCWADERWMDTTKHK